MMFCFAYRKGVIWFALATAAEVPPLVGPATLSVPTVSLIFSLLVGAHGVGLEW
jgi:hypothetical protein